MRSRGVEESEVRRQGSLDFRMPLMLKCAKRLGVRQRSCRLGIQTKVRRLKDYYMMPIQGMAVGPQRTSHPSGPCHLRFGGFLILEDRESHVIPAKAGIHRTWVPAYARTTFVLRWITNPRRPRSLALGQQADLRPSEDSELDLLTSGLPTYGQNSFPTCVFCR